MTALPLERCDVLIVGAGPAGLAAAEAAGASGAQVTVIDDNPAPGGQIWRSGPGHLPPRPALALREALARRSNVNIMSGWRVVARGDAPRRLLLESETAATWIEGERLILATGARELLLPFPGWTLPGVTGAGGLQALIKGGLDVRGQRIVIAGSGPLLLAAAATARAAGAQVLRVAEQTRRRDVAAFAAGLWRYPGKALQAFGMSVSGWTPDSLVLEALGEGRLNAVRLRRGIGDGGREETVECDRLACGFGLAPNAEPGRLLGCGVDDAGALITDEWQATSIDGIYAAGECAGIGGVDAALEQGAIAGFAATGQRDAARERMKQRARWRRFAEALQRRFALRDEVRALAAADTIVCRCEDVPRAALADCDDWLTAKLHTRCGMGPCQGRICGAATRVLFGWVPAAPHHLLAPARIETLALAGDAGATR